MLKEGPAEDFANKEKIAGLLRFASTQDDSGEQSVALADYLARAKEGQDKIYYLTGESYAQVKNSPHLEVFRKKGIEVLLLTDRIDEWLMSYLNEFDGKAFVDIARGDLDLGKLDSEEDKKAQEEVAKDKEGLVERLKGALGDSVAEVRVSHRLTDSCGDPGHWRAGPGPADAPDPGSQRAESAGVQADLRVQPEPPADREAGSRAERRPFRRAVAHPVRSGGPGGR